MLFLGIDMPLLTSESDLTALSSLTSGRGTFTMTFSSYEPEVASTDFVKLDKASQLVPADVIR